MSDHTPEPWVLSTELPTAFKPVPFADIESNVIIGKACGYPNSGYFPTDEEALANARRIVACVNACEGMLTEMLEGLKKPIFEHLTHVDQHAVKLSQQIIALRAALEESRCYVKAHTVHHAPEDGGPWALLEQIDAALAQCQGEPT